MLKIKPDIKLFMVIIIAIIVRYNGILWDQGMHLHPDERMIIMVADSIHFFDKLNPHFFSYGSLPIYLLKGFSQIIGLFIPSAPSYDGMLVVGRLLSIGFDIVTLFLIYKITLLLFKNQRIGIFATFFYAISFFPIQNTHFYTVDTLLTMLTTLLLYLLLKWTNCHCERNEVERGNLLNMRLLRLTPRRDPRNDIICNVAIIGIIFAAMMATKFTAIIFYPIIILTFFIRTLNNDQILIKKIEHFLILNTYFLILTSIFYFLFMPYTFFDFPTFFKDITQQLKMNSDPYIFPYTLQYIGTTPYLYYLKNIFLWGLGPFISVLSIYGLITILLNCYIAKKNNKLAIQQFNNLTILFIFYFLYFLVIGQSAVKFMRYMLPIYPFLAILAGYGFYSLMSLRGSQSNRETKQSHIKEIAALNFVSLAMTKVPAYIFLLLTLLWSIMFLNIYTLPHTRITATNWILKNIPYGSKLAVEHWDDRLPITGGENYQTQELTLYDYPDDDQKWIRINKVLKDSQYIIIASNRLYKPLQKLNNCKKYKRCYLKTTEYYKKLFSGLPVIARQVYPEQSRREAISFQKIAEFSSFPTLNIGNWKLVINDSSSDESFSVYDHPDIMIFKKI
jgi:hypothetical protein